MINSAPPPGRLSEPEEVAVGAIVRAGPRGALTLAGIATAIVVALWFAFYLLVFVPRGALP
jgi:hypothetical protein